MNCVPKHLFLFTDWKMSPYNSVKRGQQVSRYLKLMVDSLLWVSNWLQHLTSDSSTDMGFAEMNPLSVLTGNCTPEKAKSRVSVWSMLPIKMNQDVVFTVAEMAFQIHTKCKWELCYIPESADLIQAALQWRSKAWKEPSQENSQDKSFASSKFSPKFTSAVLSLSS